MSKSYIYAFTERYSVLPILTVKFFRTRFVTLAQMINHLSSYMTLFDRVLLGCLITFQQFRVIQE